MVLSTQPVSESELVSDYTIAGRLIRVEAADDAAQWVTRFLNGFHLLQTAPSTDDKPNITLKVEGDCAHSIPDDLPSFAINQGVCYKDEARYFLAVNESLIVVDTPSTRLIRVCFGNTPHARHPTALVNAFSYGLQAALRRTGLYDVHAAGLLDPVSGGAALFVGTSGSGKTTLTLRLTESGWRYLSDDMVVLFETPAGLDFAGLRRLFSVAETSISGSSLARIGEMLGAPVASDPRKRRLEPETAFPDSRVERCRPRVIFFPQITDEAVTVIKPLSAREAMQQLVRFCPWASYDVHTAPDYLRVLAQLANQCRAYELFAGRDLLHNSGATTQLLSPYMTD